MILKRYTFHQLVRLMSRLVYSGVFNIEAFDSGLFPAVGAGSDTEEVSGYRSVWIRDNVHIAYAHYVCGSKAAAVKNALALADFLLTQQKRMRDIIAQKTDPADPMNRPHIRFSGDTGREIRAKWPHAQNDALGYFLWFFSILSIDHAIAPETRYLALLSDLVRYLFAIAYWEDEDSGHWEEQRKVSASSIGVVNAGLRAYRDLIQRPGMLLKDGPTPLEVSRYFGRGMDALARILPFECIQDDPLKHRRYDAALLFLIDPLDIVDREASDQILNNVRAHLVREHGIVRYPLDSYWGPDYRSIPAHKRTADLSEDIIQRDDFAKAGSEARWTIFDPIVSLAYGKLWRETRDERYLDLQTHHFNRTLLALVRANAAHGRLALPEAFFLEQGRYVPNDHLPLQWAHANLWRAGIGMGESLDLE